MQVIGQQSREEVVNNEHLNLLSIFFFIMGGLSLLGAFVLLIYSVVFGAIMSNDHIRQSMNNSGEDVGMIFNILTGVFGLLFLLLLAVGVLQIVSGFKLRKRTHRILSMVMGIVVLPSFPIGTALGVFTIIVLSRPSVIEMYRKAQEKIDEEKYGIRNF